MGHNRFLNFAFIPVFSLILSELMSLKHKNKLVANNNNDSEYVSWVLDPGRKRCSAMEDILALQQNGFSPIILVPPVFSISSRLTVSNALRFIKDGIYEEISSDDAIQKPELPIIIERRISGKTLKFRITNDASKLTYGDWLSVVAMFTDGKAFQFKNWPFASDSDVLESICSFNLRFSEDYFESKSKKIKSLILQKYAREYDAAVSREFWKTLENYMAYPRVRRFSFKENPK
jgi:hypothetical protein